MRAEALFASLKARFAAGKIDHITINADEVAEWPDSVFDEWLKAKLLAPVEPAQSLECRGCEEACIMPVTVFAAEGKRPARAFIACDKPVNFGRVPVAFTRLRQWQMTRAAFEKLQRTWILPAAGADGQALRKSKAPATFRIALERLLAEIERRAVAQRVLFDRKAMPGLKVDFQAVADKFDSALDRKPRTFDDYLDGLCAFKRGARQTDFYRTLFPEYFK